MAELPVILGATANAIATVPSAVSNLSAALSGVATASAVGSAIRSINLPAAGEAVGTILDAVAMFAGDPASGDWRARLSIANAASFKSSPVFEPLRDAGGLIFPYTPTIQMQAKAEYSPINITHTNYPMKAYKNSDAGQITINAPMHVEDSIQGQYWIAAFHYLKSLTKMFTGSDAKAGNPPPIVKFNAYGNYMFKDIPVVVVAFSVTLDNKCDYIGVKTSASAAGLISSIANGVGGISDAIGDTFSGLSGITDVISDVAGGVSAVAGLASSFGLGGSTSTGIAHVPTESNFSITLQPVYSRDSVRKFSLDSYVTGAYLYNSFGYI